MRPDRAERYRLAWESARLRAIHAVWVSERFAERLREAQARLEQARQLVPEECWVTRRDDLPPCTSLIGGSLNGRGTVWTEEMCCLPCRLRAVLT